MNTTFSISRSRLPLPVVVGTIERRILINFRCRPSALASLLPAPFRPKIVRGWGIGGVCLIRLAELRPAMLPAIMGLASENAAHRIAVEWDEHGTVREGVFIPRRDSSLWFNRCAGGKLFPGFHHAARFRVLETFNRYKLEVSSSDGAMFIRVNGEVAAHLPRRSIFRSLDEASEFFRGGSLGWSARPTPNTFDGLELACDEWRMEPMNVDYVESSFFKDGERFPAGATEFDSAFLMRDVRHRWYDRGMLRGGAGGAPLRRGGTEAGCSLGF